MTHRALRLHAMGSGAEAKPSLVDSPHHRHGRQGKGIYILSRDGDGTKAQPH